MRLVKRQATGHPGDTNPTNHVPSDEEFARAAEGSGFTVDELRSLLAVHPTSFEDLAATARFAKSLREGREALTSFEIWPSTFAL